MYSEEPSLRRLKCTEVETRQRRLAPPPPCLIPITSFIHGFCQRWYAWSRNHFFYNWLISFTSFRTAYRVTRRFYLIPQFTFSATKLFNFLRWGTMWTYLAVQWWAARIFWVDGVPSRPRIISFTTGFLSTGSRYEWALLVFLYKFQKKRLLDCISIYFRFALGRIVNLVAFLFWGFYCLSQIEKVRFR